MPKNLLPPEAAPEQELALFALRRTIFPQPSWTWRITKPPSQHPLLTSAPAHISSLHLHLSHLPCYKQQLRQRYKQMQRSPHTSTNLTHHLAQVLGATSHRSCFQKHRRSKSSHRSALTFRRQPSWIYLPHSALASNPVATALKHPSPPSRCRSQRFSSVHRYTFGPKQRAPGTRTTLLLSASGNKTFL